jgi:phosphoribosyl-AMP cyclohydrolase
VQSGNFAESLWESCNKALWSHSHNLGSKRDMASTENADREAGFSFQPKYDSAGLVAAIAQDVVSGEVLMFAFMDAEALAATRETGLAHFHSRSRGRLWQKGESSGNVLRVHQILVDCDQDALVLKVRPAGPACHTGEFSCFYRELGPDGLSRID